MPFRTSREHFEDLVEKALDNLPEQFKGYITNVGVFVEDYPSRDLLRRTGLSRTNLLGLFTGVPYPERGGFFNIPQPSPEEIILFRKNLERISSSEAELMMEITKTVIHEIGHYFGLSEENLRKYE